MNGQAAGVAPVSAVATCTPLYVAPPEAFSPLRVVLLLPDPAPAWLLRFAALAAASRWIEPVVIPVAGARVPEVADVAMDVRAYLALERFRRRHGDNAGPLAAAQLESCSVAVDQPALAADMAPAALRKAVAALRPDLILLLGQQAWGEALADCAGSGCWVLDAGLVDPIHGGLDLLAPMLAGEDATELGLELAYSDGRTECLQTSWGSTQRYSFHEQRELAMRKLPALLLRALRGLAGHGLDLPTHGVAVLRLAPRSPVFAAGLRAFARACTHFIGRRVESLQGRRHGEPWRLVLRHGDTPLDPRAPVVGAHTTLQPGRDQAWADPCLVEAGDRRLLFVEEFPQDMGSDGIIVCLELRDDGSTQRLGVALEEPFHLSYPQPFRWQGQWYMTVESGAARRVSLYRADDFPLRWKRVSDLIEDRACVDPTLHHHHGHWYLFANVSESGGSTCDELFLFVADSPMGPFRPHPANPIVSDVRHARPAGRLFKHRGRLVRPAQNCGPSYGAEVAFREITLLSPTHYEERPLGRLAAWKRDLDGCHTYSAIDGVEVLDVRDRSRSGSA